MGVKMSFDVVATLGGALSGTLGGAVASTLGIGAVGVEEVVVPAIIEVKLRMARMCWSLAAAVSGTVWPRRRRTVAAASSVKLCCEMIGT